MQPLAYPLLSTAPLPHSKKEPAACLFPALAMLLILLLLPGKALHAGQDPELKGSVKSVTETYHTTVEQKGEWVAVSPIPGGYTTTTYYTPEGQETHAVYFIKGKMWSKSVPEYAAGRVVAKRHFDEDGDLMTHYKTEHGPDSLPHKQTVYDQRGIALYTYTFAYTQSGLLHKISSHDPGGKLMSEAFMEHDAARRVIKSQTKLVPDDGISRIYTYRYLAEDEKGNWTKRLETDSNGNTRLLQRTIEYYD